MRSGKLWPFVKSFAPLPKSCNSNNGEVSSLHTFEQSLDSERYYTPEDVSPKAGESRELAFHSSRKSREADDYSAKWISRI